MFDIHFPPFDHPLSAQINPDAIIKTVSERVPLPSISEASKWISALPELSPMTLLCRNENGMIVLASITGVTATTQWVFGRG